MPMWKDFEEIQSTHLLSEPAIYIAVGRVHNQLQAKQTLEVSVMKWNIVNYDAIANWQILNERVKKNQDLSGIEPGPLVCRKRILLLRHSGSQSHMVSQAINCIIGLQCWKYVYNIVIFVGKNICFIYYDKSDWKKISKKKKSFWK